MKKKIFIYFVPIVIIILIVSLFALFNHKNNNTNKTNEKNFVKKNIDNNVEIQQSSERIEGDKNNESIEMQQSDSEIKNENNSANSNIINTNNQNGNIKNSNSNISTNTSVQTYVETKTLNEWEKLGISEWDYYHTPAPNEGELATGISDCDNEANNIISKYKVVAHSGDTYSYSDDYLGCWIVIVFSDNSRIFYNEFKSREKTGEFNYLLRNTN